MTSEPASEGYPPGRPFIPASDRGRVRLRFAKGYDLRLLGHQDLLRAFERLIRRAEVPINYSRGFNPHPKMSLALSLPLGVIGLEEVLEIELERPLPVEPLLEALRRQATPGLRFHEIKAIDRKLVAQVAQLCYRLRVPQETVPALREKIPELLASPQLPVHRERAPRRAVDLRPSIYQLRLVERSAVDFTGNPEAEPISTWQTTLELELRPTPAGTARPEEVYALLGQPDLLERGSVLERSRLLLVDEIPPITVEGASCPRSC